MDNLEEFQGLTKMFKLFFYIYTFKGFYLSGSPPPEDKQSQVCFGHSLDSVLFYFLYRI